MNSKELKEKIFNSPRPSNWRDGQFVFNYIDAMYGVARHIQFRENVDCFYDDSKIDEFIDKAVDIINDLRLE